MSEENKSIKGAVQTVGRTETGGCPGPAEPAEPRRTSGARDGGRVERDMPRAGGLSVGGGRRWSGLGRQARGPPLIPAGDGSTAGRRVELKGGAWNLTEDAILNLGSPGPRRLPGAAILSSLPPVTGLRRGRGWAPIGTSAGASLTHAPARRPAPLVLVARRPSSALAPPPLPLARGRGGPAAASRGPRRPRGPPVRWGQDRESVARGSSAVGRVTCQDRWTRTPGPGLPPVPRSRSPGHSRIEKRLHSTAALRRPSDSFAAGWSYGREGRGGGYCRLLSARDSERRSTLLRLRRDRRIGESDKPFNWIPKQPGGGLGCLMICGSWLLRAS